MVILHIKRGDESHFLLETKVTSTVDDVVTHTAIIHNGRLKVWRICSEMELLGEHGPSCPPEMQGLTPDQIIDLKLTDEWADKCEASGGYTENSDPCGRRNGRQPLPNMQQVLKKTIAEAKAMIHKEQVKSNTIMTEQHIIDALDILRGAVTIVYPMGLPPYDPIREELENREDLSGTQDSKLVLEPAMTQLWFAGKELQCGEKMSKYIGNNEKTKVIVKVQRRGAGAPGREPVMNEEQRKELMVREFRRREEIKKLDEAEDNSYHNSQWADNHHLQRQFQGLNNIKWKPH